MNRHTCENINCPQPRFAGGDNHTISLESTSSVDFVILCLDLKQHGQHEQHGVSSSTGAAATSASSDSLFAVNKFQILHIIPKCKNSKCIEVHDESNFKRKINSSA